LLEELHSPCEDARKKWAVKLPDLLKPQSSSMQEAESPEGHISAAIQHLDEAHSNSLPSHLSLRIAQLV
jgi:hypothetical protein